VRVVRNFLKEFFVCVYDRKVRFVAFFDRLDFKLGQGSKPRVVAKSVVFSLPPHATDDILVLIRYTLLNLISGYTFLKIDSDHWIDERGFTRLRGAKATDGSLLRRVVLDDVLVLAMGEFGRTPQIGTQGSSDGRNHWPIVMSMTVAGGGFRHGQVIGATERDAGQIQERPVTPGDLAATIFHHMGVPTDVSYLDNRGRPRIVIDQGKPIAELCG
jgi:hypothetical protein